MNRYYFHPLKKIIQLMPLKTIDHKGLIKLRLFLQCLVKFTKDLLLGKNISNIVTIDEHPSAYYTHL